jgi:ribose transport system substrate-binding protein
MKKSKTLAVAIFFGLFVMFTVSMFFVGEEVATAASKKLRVGFSEMETNMPFRIAELNSMIATAEERGIELIVTDAQGSTAKQVSDIEDLIAQQVDYIVMNAREDYGVVPALESAKRAGIPVIVIARPAAGVPGEDYVTYIAADFVWEGEQAAKLLIEATGGKANIVELTGTQGSGCAAERYEGFRKGLANHPDMKIIASQTADFTRALGQKVMENIIQAKGDEITALYAHNDEMALGAIQALKAAGMEPGKDVQIVSIDAENDGVQAVADGEISGIVECSPFFGPSAFDVIEKLEKGESIPTRITNYGRIVTVNNAQEFVGKQY